MPALRVLLRGAGRMPALRFSLWRRAGCPRYGFCSGGRVWSAWEEFWGSGGCRYDSGMATSGDIFRQVREAVDIVEIVGEHLALKRAGREFKCLCPFHEDHRPSMAVVPHKQIFHCFVCGTAGDVFSFVEKYHKMTKGEALRMLAQRAGIKLPELPGAGAGGRNGTRTG